MLIYYYVYYKIDAKMSISDKCRTFFLSNNPKSVSKWKIIINWFLYSM